MTKYNMGFYVENKQWYAYQFDRVNPQIMIGDYPEGGGTRGEFSIDWELLGGAYIPRLKCYDDAWEVLANEPSLIKALGELNNKNSTQEEIVEVLLSLGYRDLTQCTREEK